MHQEKGRARPPVPPFVVLSGFLFYLYVRGSVLLSIPVRPPPLAAASFATVSSRIPACLLLLLLLFCSAYRSAPPLGK